MKNLHYTSKLLILLALCIAGLGVFALWQGETTNNATDENRPDRRPAASRTESDTGKDSRYRPAQRQAGSGTRHSDPASSQIAKTNETSAIERPRNADGSILRRGGGLPQIAGKNGEHGARHFSLREILTSGKLSARQRVAAIESLRSSGSLSDEDLAAVQDYLAIATPPEGTAPAQHHWIVDELITTMRVNGADNAALSRALASVYRNQDQHMTVRDYALQHLGHLRSEGGDTKIINASLQAAASEKQGTIAGTALLALNQSKEDPGVGDKAFNVATDTTVDLRSRITAMQVIGKQGNTAALPLATTTATDSTQPVALRMAAIATIADLGAKDQQPLLKNLSHSRDTRLRSAAKAALTKLSEEN